MSLHVHHNQPPVQLQMIRPQPRQDINPLPEGMRDEGDRGDYISWLRDQQPDAAPPLEGQPDVRIQIEGGPPGGIHPMALVQMPQQPLAQPHHHPGQAQPQPAQQNNQGGGGANCCLPACDPLSLSLACSAVGECLGAVAEGIGKIICCCAEGIGSLLQ